MFFFFFLQSCRMQIGYPPTPRVLIISQLNLVQFFFHLFWSFDVLVFGIPWLPLLLLCAQNFLYHLVPTLCWSSFVPALPEHFPCGLTALLSDCVVGLCGCFLSPTHGHLYSTPPPIKTKMKPCQGQARWTRTGPLSAANLISYCFVR